ncbi:hypothetical protein PPERSA_03484 [Pseudocohnilembus persalinus]|uniref:Peptidyl-prolyl cis-trans isomerase FKBP4 n=1 Tax=Pseudocohnilembus persalinus TaxID=266149 RepID=A0A0V0QBS7_PSEPJ|nr:hypothetical protein PPERSA_03484 [Pseudocohnilembus persalinus]|eukprot:KRW99683.1 hypothetical protein PPERSA_03484 [Pseudocohnilembus persalinus]
MSGEETQINKFLTKKIVKEGVGNTPQNLQEVFFHYILKDQNQNFLSGTDMNHFVVTIGQNQTHWYIEEALKVMKIGERSELIIKNPEFIKEATEDEKNKFELENFEDQQQLFMEIEIVRFGQLKNNNWDLTHVQRIEKANELKLKGNEQIKAQSYKEAQQFYTEALQIVRNDNCQELKNSLLNNLSLAYLKLKEYQACIQTCKQALEFQNRNIKIYYRLGCAYMFNQDYQDAKNQFNIALKYDPDNNDVKKELENLKIVEKKNIQKQQAQFSKMFK